MCTVHAIHQLPHGVRKTVCEPENIFVGPWARDWRALYLSFFPGWARAKSYSNCLSAWHLHLHLHTYLLSQIEGRISTGDSFICRCTVLQMNNVHDVVHTTGQALENSHLDMQCGLVSIV